jgi:hypothetical protein
VDVRDHIDQFAWTREGSFQIVASIGLRPWLAKIFAESGRPVG